MSASEEFVSAFPGSGHMVVQCGICNRVHFARDERAGDWDVGELETLEHKALEQPEGYIGHDGDTVHGVDLGAGTPAVVDCECDGVARYERWVWGQRDRIISYLTARIAAEKTRANTNAAALRTLTESGRYSASTSTIS